MSNDKPINLKHNIIFQLTYQLILILSPIIVTPYLARILGPTELGKYSYGYSIAYYFVLLGTLGITTHGSRQIAIAKIDIDKLNNTFSDLFWLHLLSAITSVVLYTIYIIVAAPQNRIISWIFLFYVASVVFDVKWLFYGLEKFNIAVFRNFILKLASIISIFIFVNNRSHVNRYTFIIAFITFFISELSLFILVVKYVKIKKPCFRRIVMEIKPLFIMFIPSAAALVCRQIGKVMLGTMSTFEQVGLFESIDKIFLLLVLLNTTIGDVVLPRMSNLIADGKRKVADKLFNNTLRICIVSSCAFAFGIAAIAPEFIPLFLGNEFLGSIRLLVCISPAIVFLGISATVRKQYLVPRFKNKVFVTSMGVGVFLNVFINFLLIPKYQALGAVFGTLIAEFFILFVQYIMTQKEINYRPYFEDVAAFSFIGILMYNIVRCIPRIISPPIKSIFFEVTTGMIVFSGLSFFYLLLRKDYIYLYIIRFINKHVKRNA